MCVLSVCDVVVVCVYVFVCVCVYMCVCVCVLSLVSGGQQCWRSCWHAWVEFMPGRLWWQWPVWHGWCTDRDTQAGGNWWRIL